METHKANDIVKRLSIIEGHLKKVKEMVENGSYCIDTLNQSLAVQSALKEVDTLILENHLTSCVADAIRAGKTRETVEEVIKVVKRSRKT